MFKQIIFISISILALLSATAHAKEEHTEAALRHASAAAASSTADSIRSHASKALTHLQDAMVANKRYQVLVNHIQQSKIHLYSAMGLAAKGNIAEAKQSANEAVIHLQRADE